MRSIIPALALAVCAALPAAAQGVSVQARAFAGGVDVYYDAMEAGVPAPWLYQQSSTRFGRSALPARGTFAYFGDGRATYAAVVTDVWSDGTVTLEHATPMGRMAFRMNLERPNRHLRLGTVINDYVSFVGPARLASHAFHGYAQPPPRTVVVHRIQTHHRGHRGHVGPVVYRDPPRSACHPAGHPGRGNAHGLCKDNGRRPDVVVVHRGGNKGNQKAKKKNNNHQRAPQGPVVVRR